MPNFSFIGSLEVAQNYFFGRVGVLDDIKAISAFNLVEVEVEAELGNYCLKFVSSVGILFKIP